MLHGLAVEELEDVDVVVGNLAVWTLCSLAVHDLLIIARGWTSERYQAWLSSALIRELLPEV
jgi:hypothetical protein